MKNRELYLESVALYMQASNLILSTLPLQKQIQICQRQLLLLINSENTPFRNARMHDLRDEIFSCKIEIQALRLKSNRLLKEAPSMRSASTETV